jgi:hypothetical protein
MLRELVTTNAVDVVPKEWKTTKGWAQEENESVQMTLRMLRQGVEQGVIEMRKFRVNKSGVVRPVPHYRIVKRLAKKG